MKKQGKNFGTWEQSVCALWVWGTWNVAMQSKLHYASSLKYTLNSEDNAKKKKKYKSVTKFLMLKL